MRRYQQTLRGFIICVTALFFGVQMAFAAPYAAVVIDARDGSVIYSRNGNQPLHPASLTKMMTLYIVFSRLKSGRMRLDQRIPISQNAASEPPSKIGLKAGSSMELRYLIRAAAIKSANDASTALGEAVAGSEANFAILMTQTARQLGMRNTQFKNAHGLTATNHFSSAYDMAILGRRLIYDFPEYYNIFSRQSDSTPLGQFRSSNIRFLKDYPGADGIKTGYTAASGYNLVGSAKHGNTRIIVSMFGGQSSYQRNEQISALLDLGFRQAKKNVKLSNLPKVTVPASPSGKTAPKAVAQAKSNGKLLAPSRAVAPPAREVLVTTAAADVPQPESRPGTLKVKGQMVAVASAGKLAPSTGKTMRAPTPRPAKLNVADANSFAATPPAASSPAPAKIVARAEMPSASNSEGLYAVQLAAKPTKVEAETYLVATSIVDGSVLGDAVNQVVSIELNGTEMYRPRFSGVSKEKAQQICSRIQARNEQCYVISPNGNS